MKKYLLLISGMFFLMSINIKASCDFSPSAVYPTKSVLYYTAPLLGNMTVSIPAGAAVGDVIYQQSIQIKNFPSTRISCDSAADFYFGHEYASTPKARSAYRTDIYETGVPGIGVKVMVNGTADYPYISQPIAYCGSTKACIPDSSQWYHPNKVMFIKTSNDVSAGKILASDLPTIRYIWGQKTGMVPLHIVSLSGSITINVPTCDISTASGTMTVPLGQHKLEIFTGKGTASPWKDASIKLINCGRFYGETSTSIASFDGKNTSITGTLGSNKWSMTISPYNGVIDQAKGIIDIDDDNSRATGIGIQLSTTESTAGLIDLSAPVKGALPNDGSQNITIPLYARYIQTDNAVTAGKANGKLMYTITYQ